MDVSHAGEVGAMDETWVVGRQDRTDAVSALFLAHHRRLVGLSSLLVDDKESAEEIVQEAFLALYRQYRLLRDPSAAVAYLNRCVVNGGRSPGRSRGLRPPSSPTTAAATCSR